MGEPSKFKNSFCESPTFCRCEKKLKSCFFTDYKRFGIHVFVEGGFLKIQSTRAASREPSCIYMPLEKVAEIFATENVWQVINSAVSGQKKLKNEKDLVRLYSLSKMGANGSYILQLTVPRTGGLNLAVLTQVGDEAKGLPTTVIHMLPVEVMLFVEMLPYYLINRQDGGHTFWTTLAAILNLKYWVEDALEKRNTQFLTFVLNCLKRGNLKEVMADVATFPDKKHVSLDVESLRHNKFNVNFAKVNIDDFAMVICNHIFRLRFKLVDWEGRDDFTSHAKVIGREPPKPVYCHGNDTYKATYELTELEVYIEAVEGEGSQDSEEDFFEPSQETKKVTKRKGSVAAAEKEESSEEKKGRLSDEEWKEIMAAAELMHNDSDDMEEGEIRLGQSPVVQQQQQQEQEQETTFETVRPVELTNVREVTLTEGRGILQTLCLHFHLGETNSTNIISYEGTEKSFKLSIESKPRV